MQYLTGIALWLTNYRFSKQHRWDETWQYRYLKTTRANQVAYSLAALTGIGAR